MSKFDYSLSKIIIKRGVEYWNMLLCVELVSLHKKMKFSIKDFFSKCHQIRRKLRFWSYLLKKSLMENIIFCAVYISGSVLKCRIVSSNKYQSHIFDIQPFIFELIPACFYPVTSSSNLKVIS